MRMREHKIKMQRIRCIFISHLHGDHYYGLLGLLNSMHLLGRHSKLKLVCHSDLKQVFDLQMRVGKGRLNFEVEFVFLDSVFDSGGQMKVYEDGNLTVEAFPLEHRIPCCGFVFREKQKDRPYLPEPGLKYGVKVKDIPAIKKGADFRTDTGEIISNAQLTEDPPIPRSYAFCTDTRYSHSTANFVRGVDCLYHEATFIEADSERAEQTFHSTASQAAEIAKLAEVRSLLIGHFSARYQDLEPLRLEAVEVFANTELATEGRVFEI